MRDDLNKLLCERERHGHDRRFHDVRRLRKVDLADAEEVTGGRESMKQRHHLRDTKQLNENLNPLWGAIRKNAGRPWDKVYSEFCSVFDKRSVINQHILTHLFQFVAVNTVERDGKVFVRLPYVPVALNGDNSVSLEECYFQYYVHPRTGLLLKNPHYQTWRQQRRKNDAKRLEEQQRTRRAIDEHTELRCINGVWYVVELRPTPREYTQRHLPLSYGAPDKKHVTRVTNVYPVVFDVIDKQDVCYPHRTKYAVSKRSASHQELKKHGVIK